MFTVLVVFSFVCLFACGTLFCFAPSPLLPPLVCACSSYTHFPHTPLAHYVRSLLVNVPATCYCVSGKNLLIKKKKEKKKKKKVRVSTLNRSCRSNLHPFTAYLRPGQPVLAPILWRQAPGWVATKVPVSKSQVWNDRRKRGAISVPPALEADSLPLGRLVGLVVKASASRAEDPGFESRLRRDFFRGRVIPVT